MKTSAELINQTSGLVDYHTPIAIIEAARRVLGQIDLDPASSEAANKRVKAEMHFTKEIDGLSIPWCGFGGSPSKLWMNHPFGRGLNEKWINKLESEFDCGNVSEACCITYACTSEKWFQPLLRRPQCFLSPRTNYLLPDGTVFKGVTKGSVVTYFGKNWDRFADEFKRHGITKVAV